MRKICLLVVALVLLAGLLVIPGVGDSGKVLAAGNTVTVTVLQRNGGAVVQGATVAMRVGGPNGSLFGWKNTDGNGLAQFTMGDGNYTCLVSKTPSAGTVQQSFSVSGASVNLTMYLTQYTITVSQHGGPAIAGAFVGIRDAGWSYLGGWTTDSNGKVQVWAPDGNYTAQASISPCAGVASNIFTVAEGSPNGLTQYITSFLVMVQSPAGSWLGGVKVEVRRGGSLSLTGTASVGRYTFWAPDDTYYFRVYSGVIMFTSGNYIVPTNKSVLAVLNATFSSP